MACKARVDRMVFILFLALLLQILLKIKGESSMKKDKESIKLILINLIIKFIYDVCVNYLETALLANALYKFFHYENK